MTASYAVQHCTSVREQEKFSGITTASYLVASCLSILFFPLDNFLFAVETRTTASTERQAEEQEVNKRA